MVVFECKYCLRVMKSKRGLAAHLRQSAYCQQMQKEEEEGRNLDHDSKPKAKEKGANEDQMMGFLQQQPAVNGNECWRPSKIRKLLGCFAMNRLLTNVGGDEKRLREALLQLQASKVDPKQQDQVYQTLNILLGRVNMEVKRQDMSDEDDRGAEHWGQDQDYEEEHSDSEQLEDDESHSVLTEEELVEELGEEEERERDKRRRECFQDFKMYVEYAQKNLLDLTEVERASVRLMHMLIRKKAPLDTYDDVMEWYLQESGQCSSLFVSRQQLMQKLRERYHMKSQYAVPSTILLPHSKSKVVVWKKNARDNVLSLLTDPRWNSDDWLYFNDDPFAGPPDNLSYVADLNTGEAYLETYRRLITKERQILVALPLYIDGAVTGQFDKLQVTALKMTIGLLNRRARDKEYAWRNLGFVTNYTKEDTHGRKMFVESGHVSALERYHNASDDDDFGEEEKDLEGERDAVDKAADYHEILSVLLQSVKDLILDGMVVDINFKGKIYRNCELVFFVPFVKCDGDEGDKLSLSYRSRGAHVQQLCRYCQCPTAQTDDPHANFPYKTEPMMKKLFEEKNVERLRKMSQICARNAFHGLRFGLHNNRGIHGACPWELLHAILLGIFKYVRDCFFEQVGQTSGTAQELNSLAQEVGNLLTRQSDRNKPRTKFAKGILKGKLMAKEYTGVLLVMAAMLQCQKGRELLSGARRKGFRAAGQIPDWVMLVETLLQWEAYLNLPQMERKHVQRLKTKHRYLLYLLKRVADRQEGMGFKVVKFHSVLHLAQDILMYGVPMNVDTGSNESHHKTTKIAAKLTQKDVRTFEKQTSDRLDDFHVLNLAIAEIEGDRLWNYSKAYTEIHDINDANEVHEAEIQTVGGMQITTYMDSATNAVCFRIMTKMNDAQRVFIDTQFLEFVHQIEQHIGHVAGKISVFAQHKRSSIMFRAHPHFMGKGLWRDWVMIKWQSGDYPAQIWGFLDLTNLPEGYSFPLADGTKVTKGFWAIVESCDYKKTDQSMPSSEMFVHLVLKTLENNHDGSVRRRKFYVVDVETFKNPIVVFPNVGTKRDYIMMHPRDKWSDDFVRWLEAPHAHDKQQMNDAPAVT
jgi:hypothetical protein